MSAISPAVTLPGSLTNGLLNGGDIDGIRKRNIFKEMITILAAAAVVPVTLIIYGVASPPYVELMEEKM